jgi:hypothetical protein
MLLGFSFLYYLADIIKIQPDLGETHDNTVLPDKLHWIDALFFSVTKWTSEGHGEIVPLGRLGRFVAAAQSIFGYLFLTLAIYAAVEEDRREPLAPGHGEGTT